jgi:hypothetical protein
MTSSSHEEARSGKLRALSSPDLFYCCDPFSIEKGKDKTTKKLTTINPHLFPLQVDKRKKRRRRTKGNKLGERSKFVIISVLKCPPSLPFSIYCQSPPIGFYP